MMNSALLSIGTALLWSLLISQAGHAAQIERATDRRILIAAEMNGTAKAPATELSTTPTSCSVTGKGRTRALCGNHSLFGSEKMALEKSQYLSAVIITTVLVMLIVLTVLAALSLALTVIAAWARRIPRPQVERAAVPYSAFSVPGEDRQVSLRTRHSSVQRLWRKTAASSAAFRLVWFIWLVWFI